VEEKAAEHFLEKINRLQEKGEFTSNIEGMTRFPLQAAAQAQGCVAIKYMAKYDTSKLIIRF